jgi:hypothetical protein
MDLGKASKKGGCRNLSSASGEKGRKQAAPVCPGIEEVERRRFARSLPETIEHQKIRSIDEEAPQPLTTASEADKFDPSNPTFRASAHSTR